MSRFMVRHPAHPDLQATRVGDKDVGTRWALMHGGERKFDAEDERRMRALGKVASPAYEALASIDGLKIEIVECEKADAALRELNAAPVKTLAH